MVRRVASAGQPVAALPLPRHFRLQAKISSRRLGFSTPLAPACATKRSSSSRAHGAAMIVSMVEICRTLARLCDNALALLELDRLGAAIAGERGDASAIENARSPAARAGA